MPSNSARTVALAMVFCALGVASGCGRATFELLSDEKLVLAGAFNAGAESGGYPATGGKEPGGAGKAGESGGTAGSAGAVSAAGLGGSAGFGGRFSYPGGRNGGSTCLGEGGCPTEKPSCPPALPLCWPCEEKDPRCFLDTYSCDLEIHRCVECRDHSQCGAGRRCNPNTWACAKACDVGSNGGKDACGGDQRSICSDDGVCVSCVEDTDCNGGYPSFTPHCSMNICVECSDDTHCSNQEICRYGHCDKR